MIYFTNINHWYDVWSGFCGKEPTETEAENIVEDERQVSTKENNKAVSDEQQSDERNSHILIVYFSMPEDVDIMVVGLMNTIYG